MAFYTITLSTKKNIIKVWEDNKRIWSGNDFCQNMLLEFIQNYRADSDINKFCVEIEENFCFRGTVRLVINNKNIIETSIDEEVRKSGYFY